MFGPAISDGSSTGVKSLHTATEMELPDPTWKTEAGTNSEVSLTISEKELRANGFSYLQTVHVIALVRYRLKRMQLFSISQVNVVLERCMT